VLFTLTLHTHTRDLVQYPDQMRDGLHHAANRFIVHALDDLIEAREAQSGDDPLVLEGVEIAER